MWLRRMVAGLALALVVGCAVGPKFQEPHLQVIDVDLLKGDLFRQELRVRMRVQNPNSRELPVKGITYQVELAGQAFAQGESERDFVVPANGETEFDVSVTANAAAAMLKMLGNGRKAEGIEYRLTGRVLLARGLLRSLPFDQKGQLRLR
jgi:LEA14-like dessication related protein